MLPVDSSHLEKDFIKKMERGGFIVDSRTDLK